MQSERAAQRTEEFSRLIALAREILNDAAITEMSQAVVFTTSLGNTHSFVSLADHYPQTAGEIVEQLMEKNDTAVSCLVAMWSGGCLDVPAYILCEKLIALDPGNEDTLIVLQGEDCLAVRTIGSTMPHRQHS